MDLFSYRFYDFKFITIKSVRERDHMEPPSRNTRQGDTLALSTLVSGFPLGRRMSGGPVTQDECRRGRWNSEIVPSWVFLRDRNSTLSHNYLLTSGDSLWLGGSYGGRESFLELGFSSGARAKTPKFQKCKFTLNPVLIFFLTSIKWLTFHSSRR